MHFKCSYAADISCYADFTIEADCRVQARAKLEEMLKRGCFENVTPDPCFENGFSNERVFVSSETETDDEPLAKLEGFDPEPAPRARE